MISVRKGQVSQDIYNRDLRYPRRDGLIAQEPDPRPPWIPKRPRFEVGIQEIKGIETPQRIILAADVKVSAASRRVSDDL
jgi:hypothetical protein